MRVVVDTNVILIANGAHPDTGDLCRQACVDRLAQLVKKGRVVIDDGNAIVEEYLRRTEPRKGQRPGDVFLKWLLNNQGNRARVERVSITPAVDGSFAEFDALRLASNVDPQDRKFIAVAVKPRRKARIWEGADSKWLDWWQPLRDAGVHVDFICPEAIVRYYRRKFPDRAVPLLP